MTLAKSKRFSPAGAEKSHLHYTAKTLQPPSPGRLAAIAARNDEVIAAYLDYRALLQAGAIEGNPHAIDIPAVLGAIKGDQAFGPRSRKALWEELDQAERDRLKAAGQGVAA